MHLFSSKNQKEHAGSLNGPTGFFHRVGRDPYLDWAIIFMVTVIAMIVIIFFGFLTFEDALARLNSSTIQSTSAAVKFDVGQLTTLLSKFDARAAEHAKLEKAYDGPGDPSL